MEIAQIQPVGRSRYLRSGWAALTWIATAMRSRTASPEVQRKNALSVRSTLEQMGGVWIKLGQLLAMRNDLFSDTFCEVMAGLQDRATGFPFEDVREIVEAEYGVPLEAIFSAFQEQPFAAGSIGQLHEARLAHDDMRVAVKVQRPDAARKFQADLRALKVIVGVVDGLGLMREMSWGDLMWELERTLGEELDYRLESASIRRMRVQLRRHRIYVPKVFRRLARERVLVMEFVEGVFMSDVIATARRDPALMQRWLKENNVVPKKVGTRLYLSQMRQLFEDNLFHGDLHPGNILLLRDSRIALIDFGSVGSLERGFLRNYEMFVSAIAREEFQRAAGIYLLMVPRLPPIDLEPVIQGLMRILKSWSVRTQTDGLPYEQRSIASCYSELGRLLVGAGIPTAWAFMRVNRSQITVDASLRYLQPHADYFELGQRYFEKARKRKLKRARASVGASLQDVAQNAGDMLSELPEVFFHQLDWFRRRARNFEVQTGKASFAAGLIASLLGQTLVVMVLVAAVTSLRTVQGTIDALPPILERIAALPVEARVGLAVVGLMWAGGLWKLRRRFGQHDAPSSNQVR